MATHVFHGPWINWSEGVILGGTITVSSRSGNLLISFIATFVTIVGAQLWHILSYMFHQIRSSRKPQDGLHYQQQNILRNTSSPGGAAWSFMVQTWYWRGKASMLLLRTLPWTLFSVIYLVLFGVLATFSSEVSAAAGRVRLLKPVESSCGYWSTDGDPSSDLTLKAYNQKMANESIVSATYARACYGGTPIKGQCDTFPVPSLKWTAESDVDCPFPKSMVCVGGENAAFKMTSEKIDSTRHLGINAPEARRVTFIKETTCSPIVQQRTPLNGSSGVPGMGDDGDILLQYEYGSVGGATNFTYRYNTHSYIDNFGWVTWSMASTAPHEVGSVGYNPIPALQAPKADVSIVFIAANSVRFLEPCDDPVFGAHYQDEGTYPRYATDEYVVPIACTETYEICNPNNNKCSGPVGILQLNNATASLGLNAVQKGETARIGLAAQLTGIYTQTYTRMSSSLRAGELTAGLSQLPLPANQWKIEASNWFDAGLARLQNEIQAYATGPTNITPGSKLLQPSNEVEIAMCSAQLVNDSGKTTSFSIVGLAIIFVIGGLIIFTSLVIESIVGRLQTALHKGEYKKLNWLLDDKLQLQRMLLEAIGHGTWEGALGFPTTVQKAIFGGWGDVDIQHPTLIPKSAGTMSPWAESQETVPNVYGTKQSDVFVRELH